MRKLWDDNSGSSDLITIVIVLSVVIVLVVLFKEEIVKVIENLFSFWQPTP